jgi:hypothetical protein
VDAVGSPPEMSACCLGTSLDAAGVLIAAVSWFDGLSASSHGLCAAATVLPASCVAGCVGYVLSRTRLVWDVLLKLNALLSVDPEHWLLGCFGVQWCGCRVVLGSMWRAAFKNAPLVSPSLCRTLLCISSFPRDSTRSVYASCVWLVVV